MESQTIPIQLTVMSPISIGCDEVYEPTGLVVDRENGELVSFETAEFLEMLDSDALGQFSAICAKGTIESLLELMQFMDRNRDLAQGERAALASGFAEHYQQVLTLPRNRKTIQQNLNNFKIGRTAFNGHTGLPYIPGSSIKGAIRTAVLNLRQQKTSVRRQQDEKRLQTTLLGGSFDSDPLRLVKVSDFVPVEEVKRKILYAVNLKKRPTEKDSQGPPQLLEVVEPGARFIGSITLIAPDRKSTVRKPLTRKELTEAMSVFYQGEGRREDRELRGIGGGKQERSTEEAGIPLRIGRHSGAECVTVAGHRAIKVSPPGKKPGKPADGATTLWLAAERKKPTSAKGLRPFGWVELLLLAGEEGAVLRKNAVAVLEKREQIMKDQVERLRLEEEERAIRLAEEKAAAEKRQAEESAKQAEAAAQKEQWQAMSEEERDLACIRTDDAALLNDPNNAKDPIPVIWPKMDALNPEHQQAFAAAFKERWQKEGKWNVKKKKKKQFEKVQKVKTILGES